MAREISRDELNDIINEINVSTEELGDCLNELNALEERFPEVWKDTDPNSKVNVCLDNISAVGDSIALTKNLSSGISEALMTDVETGGDN